MRIRPVQILRPVLPKRLVRVRLVQHNPLHRTGKRRHHLPLSSGFQSRQRLRGYLKVPGVVRHSRLQHGLRCGQRIPAALQRHPVKIGRPPIVMRIPLIRRHIVSHELHNSIRPGPQRTKILLLASRGRRPDAIPELRPAYHRNPHSHESRIRIRRGCVESNPHRQVIQRLHRCNVRECARRRASRGLVRAVSPRERHVVGRQPAPVRPLQPLSHLPRYRRQVRRNSPVLQRRNLSSQCGD